MKVLVLQTSDGVVYKDLLDVTETINRAYATRHGYSYRRVDGVLCGQCAWHATFNRIFLLQCCALEEVWDWVLFLDADAYVHGQQQTLEDFLGARGLAQHMVCASRGGYKTPYHWDINAGVLLWNMRHPHTAETLQAWKDMCLRSKVFQSPTWGHPLDDQSALHLVLRSRPLLFGSLWVCTGSDEDCTLNYQGPFIRQLLRSNTGNMEERVQRAKQAYADVSERDATNVKK